MAIPRRNSESPPPRHGTTSGPSALTYLRRNRTLAIAGFFAFIFLFLVGRQRTHSGSEELGSHVVVKADWGKFAYSVYATNSASVCHAVMILDALKRFGSKADRVLFYPQHWDTQVSSSTDRDSQLLVLARDKYKAYIQPTEILNVEGFRTPEKPQKTWDESVTKLLAFTLTQFDRVLHLDSDITLLKSLDELFLLPPAPVAMPRAYWSTSKPAPLAPLLMLVQPNRAEFAHLKEAIDAGGEQDVVASKKYDMELLNDQYGEHALVLPQRPYALSTGEFRSHNHSAYLGSTTAEWNARKVLNEARLVHFNDFPLPKPWIMWPEEGLQDMQPDCGSSQDGTCDERQIWTGLYEDFRERRKDVCKLLSVPAPKWEEIKGSNINT